MMNNAQLRKQFNFMMSNCFRMECLISTFGLRNLILGILTPIDSILTVSDPKKSIKAMIT